MDDQTLEGSAGEPQIELELTPTVPLKEENGEGGDPLDAIQDPVARADAKKARAIVRRHGEKKLDELEAPAAPAAPAPQGVLTKADFEKSNEKRAIRLATADEEVKANWADISPLYTPRRGRETPEDILEDIQDAVTLYKARKGTPVVPNNTAADLTVSHGAVGTGGGVTPSTPKTPNPPNFKLPSTPKEWYPKQK